MLTDITVYNLEMLDPADLRPSRRQPAGLEIRHAQIALPELNRFLYASVGGDWFWHTRLSWDYAHWMQVLTQPGYETWVAYVDATPAGYFELEVQPEETVEIAYFGLLPQFLGMGIGGRLLTTAIERAWQKGARRVWVHTCSLDHPSALANYQARGMRIFDVENFSALLPDETPGAWPGANRPNQSSVSN